MDESEGIGEKFIGNYKLLTMIAKSSSPVWIASDIRKDEKVVIKFLSKSAAALDPQIRRRSENEILAAASLKHKHIVPVLDIITTEEYTCIVQTYCAGGDLNDFVNKYGPLNEDEIKIVIKQVGSAIQYAARSGFCHRDIKLENMFLLNPITADNKSAMQIMLGDWGFSSQYTFDKKNLSDSWGTLPYAAPEVILAKNYYGPEVDIWSLGVVIYTLYTKKFPFSAHSSRAVKMNIIKGKYPVELISNMSPLLLDLLQNMIKINTEKRISISNIMEHPWVTQKPTKQRYYRLKHMLTFLTHKIRIN